jgi:predicted Zn-dependent protease
METFFKSAAETLFNNLKDNEQLILNWSGEKSLFIRFNKSKVRQISNVEQMELSLTLKSAGKQSEMSLPVTGNYDIDSSNALEALAFLRERLCSLSPLPFFIKTVNNGESKSVYDGSLLTAEEYIDIISAETKNVDLAGMLVSGVMSRGNANSLGQYHWFESTSFCFDYSLYTEKEKAVKAAYSGTVFDQNDFLASLNEARENLGYMSIENKVLSPGKYKCYLAPAAVSEILGTFAWGAAGHANIKRGSSPLLPLINEGRELSQLFTFKEDFSLGLHPRFNSEGEVADESLVLFEKGKLKNLLTSTKTAKEYDLTSNFSNEAESPRSPVISTGSLRREDILKELGTGLFISNLHYLNWSDFNKGRITGMTRFACFYVEEGKIVAPIKDLRFDETIYNIWGDNLLAVTDFAETEVSMDTYFQRSPGGKQCPGMLVKDFNFTL